jgi:hypothetical protein
VLASAGASAVSAGSAQAALISTAACSNAAVSQPFTPWGDANEYALVPGGDFETGAAGWTLTGGAHTVAGSEPYAATGKLGASSLELPAGASAQSPQFCVDAAYPTFRFFARNDSLTATLTVSVVINVPLLGADVIPVGVIAAGQTWQATPAMLTDSTLAGLLSGGVANISLRFSATGGPSQIDDVFVDPNCK